MQLMNVLWKVDPKKKNKYELLCKRDAVHWQTFRPKRCSLFKKKKIKKNDSQLIIRYWCTLFDCICQMCRLGCESRVARDLGVGGLGTWPICVARSRPSCCCTRVWTKNNNNKWKYWRGILLSLISWLDRHKAASHLLLLQFCFYLQCKRTILNTKGRKGSLRSRQVAFHSLGRSVARDCYCM